MRFILPRIHYRPSYGDVPPMIYRRTINFIYHDHDTQRGCYSILLMLHIFRRAFGFSILYCRQGARFKSTRCGQFGHYDARYDLLSGAALTWIGDTKYGLDLQGDYMEAAFYRFRISTGHEYRTEQNKDRFMGLSEFNVPKYVTPENYFDLCYPFEKQRLLRKIGRQTGAA